MKKTIVLLMALAANVSLKAQGWQVDAAHSQMHFTVDYMVMSELEGDFKKFGGKVESTNPDFTDAKINFTADVSSINTDNEMRDKHLAGDDFFNSAKYPKMTFTSTSMKKITDKKYVLEGNLTIRDVTKPVKFDVTYGGTAKDPWGNTKAGFKAVGKINRFDYNLKWNAATETGGLIAGDEVTMTLNVILIKKNNP